MASVEVVSTTITHLLEKINSAEVAYDRVVIMLQRPEAEWTDHEREEYGGISI